ncbi:MAG: IPT/TIG domain-containing protein, partial [Candidatus Desantisbacteria bacterium]
EYSPGGGHGYKKDWEGTPLDTALAIRAFVAANAIDEDVVSQDVQFLLITSNLTSDHGWDSRYYDETAASIYTTANSLIGLISCDTVNLFAPDWFIQWFYDTIDSNTSWLLNQQNSDGSFGEGTGTTYQTALAALALLETPFKDSGTLTQTIEWLKNHQLSDGSWNQNAYETALAMQVLRHVPEVSSVDPCFGTVGVRVAVTGCGYSAAEGIRIDFGTTLSIATTTASDAGTFSAGFTVDAQPYGTKTIIFTGQSSGKADRGEFFITPGRIQVTPLSGYTGALVTISGNGFCARERLQVQFCGTETVITDLAGQFTLVATVTVETRGGMSQQVFIWVEPEISRDKVYPSPLVQQCFEVLPPPPDIIVRDIHLPDVAGLGEKVGIQSIIEYANIDIERVDLTEGVEVKIYDGTDELHVEPPERDNNLAWKRKADRTWYPVTLGTHTIRVVVSIITGETDTANNEFSKDVMVRLEPGKGAISG